MKATWRDDLNLKENLSRRMPKLVKEYFEAGHEAMKDGKTWEEMHQFRLVSKRFRYTLELFRTAYGPGLEERLEDIRKVQQYLGDINDCVTSSALLEPIDGMTEFRASLHARAEEKMEKMRTYWNENFEQKGVLDKWVNYLVHYAFRPVRKSA